MDLDYYETGCDNPFLPSYWKFEKKDLGWDGAVEAERFLGLAKQRSLGSQSFPFDPVPHAGFYNSFYLHCGFHLTYYFLSQSLAPKLQQVVLGKPAQWERPSSAS